MKIIDKINSAIDKNEIFFSFEYFPPKTDAGMFSHLLNMF